MDDNFFFVFFVLLGRCRGPQGPLARLAAGGGNFGLHF